MRADLDPASITALAAAIKDFVGGVVIVSQDFRLLTAVAADIWEVKNKQIINITKQGTDITTYKKRLVEASKSSIEKAFALSKKNMK